MKVVIVINGEEWYRGERKNVMVLMPHDNEIQIAIGPIVARNRSARVARSGHATESENAKPKSAGEKRTAEKHRLLRDPDFLKRLNRSASAKSGNFPIGGQAWALNGL